MSTPTRDVHNNLAPMNLIAPASPTADTTPISVDLLGFRSAMIMIWVGIGGITFSGVNKVEFIVEHSTDNSAWAAVAQSDIVGATVSAGGIVRSLIAAKAAIDAAPSKMSYIGGRRYIRLTADFSGTHGSGTPMTAFVIRGGAEQLPTA